MKDLLKGVTVSVGETLTPNELEDYVNWGSTEARWTVLNLEQPESPNTLHDHEGFAFVLHTCDDGAKYNYAERLALAANITKHLTIESMRDMAGGNCVVVTAARLEQDAKLNGKQRNRISMLEDTLIAANQTACDMATERDALKAELEALRKKPQAEEQASCIEYAKSKPSTLMVLTKAYKDVLQAYVNDPAVTGPLRDAADALAGIVDACVEAEMKRYEKATPGKVIGTGTITITREDLTGESRIGRACRSDEF